MRPKVAIAIDYTIRIPDFIQSYAALKSEIIGGAYADKASKVALDSVAENDKEFQKIDNTDVATMDPTKLAEQNKIDKDTYDYTNEDDREADSRNFWHELNITDPKAVEFYTKAPLPEHNCGKDFDMSYSKYFYNNEHRLKFLEEYSFNLFGKGAPTNKADIDLINIAQSKLFDVILFDRAPYGRKVAHTFAFLSRAGIFVKSVQFITSNEQLDTLKEECVGFWDAKTDPKQAIQYTPEVGQATPSFLEWLQEIEKKVNSNE